MAPQSSGVSLAHFIRYRTVPLVRDDDVDMATDVARPDRAPMTIAELVSFTKKELDSDAERARLQASSAGVLPAESQAGTTLDLSSAKIHALPVEVLVLIKDRVERCVWVLRFEPRGAWSDGHSGADHEIGSRSLITTRYLYPARLYNVNDSAILIYDGTSSRSSRAL